VLGLGRFLCLSGNVLFTFAFGRERVRVGVIAMGESGMCQPKKWWWGLIPLALLWILAASLKTGPIQTDLAQRAGAALGAAGLGWGKVTMAGRDAALAGEAFEEGQRPTAVALADGTHGVRLVRDGSTLMPETRPYVWSAAREGGRLVLGGLVPSEAVRKQLVEDARKAVPAAEIVDQMRLARGVPNVFGAATAYSFAQLARLPDGKASLIDSTLTITGNAPNLDIYAAATGAGLPQGLGGSVQVGLPTVRPYQWKAVRTGNDLTLTGFVPDDATRGQIVGAARQAWPNAAVTDQQRLAAGAPAGLAGMATAALGHLGGLTGGTAGLVDTNYSLSGTAGTPDAYASVTQAVRGLPQGYTLARADIAVPTVRPYQWQAQRAGNEVALTGFVPDDATRGQIVAAARQALPGTAVIDRMRLAAGAPAGLASMASAALGHLGGLTGGIAGLVDNAYSLTGTAATTASFAALQQASRALPQGFSLARADITPPTVRPYTWGAEKAGNAITLSGHVPSDQVRATLNEAARAAAPGATVTDRMQVAAGAPQGFADLARFALGQLGRLNSGVAGLADQALSLTGSAASPQVFSDVMAALQRKLPAGASLARAEIAPPTVAPYLWSAIRDGEAVTLGGYVPGQAARQAAVTAVRQAVAGARITDNQVVAAGAPNNFDAMTAYAVRQLGRLNAGTASLTANAYTIAGAAPSQGVRNDLVAELRTLPAGYTLAREAITAPAPPPPPPPAPLPPTVSVPVPEAPAIAIVPIAPTVPSTDPCQAALNDILRDQVRFATGRADIDGASYLILSRLAQAANACPTRMVEIGAHTDSDGQPEANVELSRRRAQAVVDFLVRDGVERRRLVASGYGQLRPLAPNDTPENKARNRRVEFVVLDQEPPPPTAADICQVQFRELLRDPVLFATASAEIDARSYLLLGRLAQTAQTCPGAMIEIGAHTDSDGAEDRNLELSRRRAASVVDYLVREGVDRARLTATGYGQSRPVAPNDTPENKARNRRVEFFVK
jgi:outer membrane protein OmpA-like peptidoglycan-associated protein